MNLPACPPTCLKCFCCFDYFCLAPLLRRGGEQNIFDSANPHQLIYWLTSIHELLLSMRLYRGIRLKSLLQKTPVQKDSQTCLLKDVLTVCVFSVCAHLCIASLRQRRSCDRPVERSAAGAAALRGGSTEEPGAARTGQEGQRPVPDAPRPPLHQQPRRLAHW